MINKKVIVFILAIMLAVSTALIAQNPFIQPLPGGNISGQQALQQLQQNTKGLYSNETQSIMRYLKTKYLGMIIEYQPNKKYDPKKDDPEKIKSGEVVEISVSKDSYYFTLEDDTKVEIIIELAENARFRKSADVRRLNKQNLDMQALQTQAFISKAIASISIDGQNGSNPQLNLNQYQAALNGNGQQSFANAEEIRYVDLNNNKTRKAKAIATYDHIALETGEELNLRFVKD